MKRAWYPSLVLLFWVASTGWLLVAKVLPAWAPGAPPGHQAFHATGGRVVPVAWSVLLDGQPLGWSISRAHRGDGGGMHVESLLHVDRLPLAEVLPGWTRLLVPQAAVAEATIGCEVRGSMEIDPRGRLEAFTSTVDLADGGRIELDGDVADGDVTIRLRAGAMRHETRRHLPDSLLLGDELSPSATLPGLFPGRTWTVPVYGPFRPAHAPLEVLHAAVTGSESMLLDDRLATVDVVEYSDDPAGHREPRMRMWVERGSGRVVRQEATLAGKRIEFLRRPDDAAERLAGTIDGVPTADTGGGDG